MASAALLTKGSLARAAVCSRAECARPNGPVKTPKVLRCAPFAGKKLQIRPEVKGEFRRSFVAAKAKVEADTAAKAEAGTPAKSEVGTPAKSEAGTPAKSEAGTPAKSEAKTPAKSEAETAVPAESAAEDSIVPEVAELKEEADTSGVAPKKRLGPLSKGGTLKGAAAEGKAPSDATLGKAPALATAGKFQDSRWKDGNWDLAQFTTNGKTDWDAVIDAEVVRRTWLERNPEASTNEDPVFFDTGVVPWWAWVKRFHLPEAEKLNGRAAMVGYAAAWLVDGATGVGLVDQQGSFFGKLLLLLTVVGVLVIRKNEDLTNIKDLAQEWTFYDKQWQATWKDGPPSAGQEQSKDKEW